MYITIDVGNKTTTINQFKDFDINTEVSSKSFPTSQSYSTQLENIIQYLKSLRDITAIGIAHSGDMDESREIILDASILTDYENKNLVQDLKNSFRNIPIYMENDSACAIISEMYFGTAKDYSNAAGIYLSAGIGGSVIRKVDKTYSLFMADIGHQIIVPNGRICKCGQRGCLETYAGALAIQERFLKEQASITDVRIWDEIVEYIAVGAANMYAMFYPETIIITGDTLDQVPYIKAQLKDRILNRIFPSSRNDVKISISNFQSKAPTYGALALMKIKMGGNTIKVID